MTEPHIASAREMARRTRGGHPLRASLLLLVILALLAAATAWAALTELDSVTRTDGRVVPSGEVQVVQAAEAAVILGLHVREGDRVEPGASLVTLDGRSFEAELIQAERRIAALDLRVARLRAEADGTPFAPDASGQIESPALVASELSLFEARQSALRDEIAVLERQARQREQAVLEARIRVRTSEHTLALIREDIALMRPLVEESIEPRTTLTALLGREAEGVGRVSEAQAALAGAEAAVEEIRDRVVAARSGMRADALDELARAEAELAELRAMLPAMQARVDRSVLRAPVRGIVNRILPITLGALARPGDPLVEIVPLGDELLVEAYLPPEDVAFVRAGQDVRVSLSAYDPSRYGSIDATILRVGADAVTHPDGNARVFVVEIRTLGTLTDADGTEVEILPGMVATVDILSGKRTVLAYLTAPVVRVKDSALRE